MLMYWQLQIHCQNLAQRISQFKVWNHIYIQQDLVPIFKIIYWSVLIFSDLGILPFAITVYFQVPYFAIFQMKISQILLVLIFLPAGLSHEPVVRETPLHRSLSLDWFCSERACFQNVYISAQRKFPQLSHNLQLPQIHTVILASFYYGFTKWIVG